MIAERGVEQRYDGCGISVDIGVNLRASGCISYQRMDGIYMAKRVRVDAKGRLSIPKAVRTELGIEPGDLFFLEADQVSEVLRFAKVENPFDILAAHAIGEYKAGRTISLREFAAEQGFSLDDA
jgi:AbrB family looped-hinge helix DNA binding protein